jgi:glycosyltransferase involved in cell wall biosynthesis
MIPTYNCDDRFETALRSVLDQDPGPERMQIGVVDDASTGRRHEEIVRRLAPARVELHGRSANVGLARNWNDCIAQSRGRWVHILHQDDVVLPGFYERLGRADEDPSVGAAFCRTLFIDGRGRPGARSPLLQPTSGLLLGWLELIARHQYVLCPSIVVRRAVYEQLGGYRTDLCFVLDWEMWVRIAAHHAVWYEPEALASFRVHPGTETTRLQGARRDIADVRKAIRIIRKELPRELRAAVGSGLLHYLRQVELGMTCRAFQESQVRSGLTSLHRAFQCDRWMRFSRTGFGFYKWALKVWLSKVFGRPRGKLSA